MEKLQIDVFGKAPSLAEIEEYNTYFLKKGGFSRVLSGIFFVTSFGLLAVSIWAFLYSSLAIAAWFLGGYIFLFFIGMLFKYTGFEHINKLECFVSQSACIHLAELITKYPEVALYRDKVVGHNREFLQSEYEDCAKIMEKKACKEIYKINSLDNLPALN